VTICREVFTVSFTADNGFNLIGDAALRSPHSSFSSQLSWLSKWDVTRRPRVPSFSGVVAGKWKPEGEGLSCTFYAYTTLGTNGLQEAVGMLDFRAKNLIKPLQVKTVFDPLQLFLDSIWRSIGNLGVDWKTITSYAIAKEIFWGTIIEVGFTEANPQDLFRMVCNGRKVPAPADFW